MEIHDIFKDMTNIPMGTNFSSHAAATAVRDLSPVVNNVSMSLYGAATTMVPNGNFLLSPISILYCTTLVYLGTRHQTRQNLYSAIGYGEISESGSDEDIAGAFNQLMKDLKVKTMANSTAKTQPQNDTEDTSHKTIPEDRFQLALANAVFINKDADIDQNYLSLVNQKLKAAIENKDFRPIANHSENSRKDINKWVEQRTGDRIHDLLPPNSVNNAVAVLVNAIYFKSRWETTFKEQNTDKNAQFTLLDGKTKTVPMMKLTHPRLHYAKDDQLGLQYLEIPYVDREASMLVFLPLEKAGLREMEKRLTPQAIAELATKAGKARATVNLQLPKFKLDSGFDLVKLLKKIGVSDLFSEATADLTGMVPAGGVYIGKGFHKTFIDVNEKGTEAAGASALIAVSRSGSRHRDVVDFIADHPFMYAIRHNRSKAILFIKRLEKF